MGKGKSEASQRSQEHPSKGHQRHAKQTMTSKQVPIPVERIERTILLLRGQKVILDADLGKLYGVSTKRLNEQIRRNQARFPKDFMFQLTREEKSEVVAICDHLSSLKFSPALPLAFTEHGAIMAAREE